MFILVMDDEQARHDRFVAIFNSVKNAKNQSPVVLHAYTAEQAQAFMILYHFDMICLDHDLGARLDGRDFTRWLRDSCYYIPERILIHSQNSVAAAEMAAIIRDVSPMHNILIMPFKAG